MAGQKHFSFVRPAFYRGTSGLIYTFDLTRRSSFSNILEWKSEVEKVIGQGKPSVLVGNKIDLANQGNREVGEQDGIALQYELGAIDYYEASAKDDILVEPVFKDITLAILRASSKI